jgi:hypothetical protein
MAKPSDQTQQVMGNDVLSQGVQFVGQRMRQTLGKKSLSEGNVPPNMSRNNDDDEEFDENNDRSKKPPLLTSSSEPIYRTIEGNYIKHDNSVHETNISSHNTEGNKIENCFNHNYSSRQSLCRLFFINFVFASGVTTKVDFYMVFLFPILGKEGTSQQVVSARRQIVEEE